MVPMNDQTLDTLCRDFGCAVTVSKSVSCDESEISKLEDNSDAGEETKESVGEYASVSYAESEISKLEDNSDTGEETKESVGEYASVSYAESEISKLEDNSDTGEETKESVGEYAESSDDAEETCSIPQSFPVSEKIEKLDSEMQDLKIEHENLKKQHQEEREILKKKYLDEYNERKRLYNEVIELKGNIRVFCRCRPLNMDEVSNDTQSVVDYSSCQENELQIISSDSSKKLFRFDHVFKPEDKQDDVFVQTVPIVTSVLDGFNVCIFAYGQTGTGKTFTMEGTPESRGVNYRTLEELFKVSRERGTFMKYELLVSMLEVYNEKIRDLLIENCNQPAKKLDIKQSAEGTQEVPGLVEAHVYSTNEVWELLKCGSRARSVGSTNANELSSRSHCLVRVTVLGENLLTGQRTRSHLWLVDLAGSERVGRLDVEGERLKESQFINKSLSALGDVISALASKTAHIPYRNSKLTHLLQSSLGGDCKTLMFVQISPNAADVGETICSLNFASRVRGVEHGPARKQADPGEFFKYKQLAEKAKNDEKEMKKLQDSLQSLQLRLSAREHICRNLQEKVRDLENQLTEERKIRLKQETKALSAAGTQSSAVTSFGQSRKSTTETKPPLVPSKMRLPLRKITNFAPAPSQAPPQYKPRNSMIPLPRQHEKENMPSSSVMENCRAKAPMQARRLSVAVRPTTVKANQGFQPKKRNSIATFLPEPSSSMATPINRFDAASRKERVGRQSFVWDPKKVWRTSKVSSPMSQLQRGSSSNTYVMETPMNRQSSKFMGSPSSQAGSWKPKHPTVVALQKKLVWSPLKMKTVRNGRKSFLY